MKKTGPNKKTMLTTSPDILGRLGAFIRNSRLASGISRNRMCAAMDVSPSQLSAWEKGKAEPRFCSLIRFCSFLGIEFDRILEIYGSNVNSASSGSLMAKYSVLREESQAHVKSIIDALLISEIMSKTNGTTMPTMTQIDNKEKSAIADETITEKSIVAPVKLGRGRPRKTEIIDDGSVPDGKNERDRPCKADLSADKPPVLTKRGCPRKTDTCTTAANTTASTKHRTGRPRKTETNICEPIAPVKRGRGRPRKVSAS